MESNDSEEGSEMEELLSQLEEESLLELGRADNNQAPLNQDLERRYEKLKAQSFNSQVNTKLDTLVNSNCSTPETEESKGSSPPRSGKQEACGLAHAIEVHFVDKEAHANEAHFVDKEAHANEVHFVDKESSSGNDLANASKVAHGDAAKKASVDIPHISPLKLPHTQQEASESIDRPLSPPSPPVGCSCFFLSSKRGKKKQNIKLLKGEELGSNNKDKAEQEKIEEEWVSVLKELEGVEGGQWDMNAGIFDVKRTEMEFKRVSKREKQLTQEAQKFLEMVASSSARFTSPPHYAQ